MKPHEPTLRPPSSVDDGSTSSSPFSPNALVNRTSSLPNLFGGQHHMLKPFPAEADLTAPSPVPSEPCYTFNAAADRLSLGPPKPPRDPYRMSGV